MVRKARKKKGGGTFMDKFKEGAMQTQAAAKAGYGKVGEGIAGAKAGTTEFVQARAAKKEKLRQAKLVPTVPTIPSLPIQQGGKKRRRKTKRKTKKKRKKRRKRRKTRRRKRRR